jgi:hypothetical protein
MATLVEGIREVRSSIADKVHGPKTEITITEIERIGSMWYNEPNTFGLVKTFCVEDIYKVTTTQDGKQLTTNYSVRNFQTDDTPPNEWYIEEGKKGINHAGQTEGRSKSSGMWTNQLDPITRHLEEHPEGLTVLVRMQDNLPGNLLQKAYESTKG